MPRTDSPSGPGEQLAAYVSAVLMAHVVREHRNGRRVPDGVVDLARALANARQSPPNVDARWRRREAPVMPVTVDYATAAAALGVSLRTISRRVAAGALPVVGSGTGRRIPTAALVDQETP